jgi:hypothetical protein
MLSVGLGKAAVVSSDDCHILLNIRLSGNNLQLIQSNVFIYTLGHAPSFYFSPLKIQIKAL